MEINMDIEHELRKNVKDLQEQLNRAHKRIKTLQDEIYSLRRKINPEASFSSNMSGWALMEDPEHR
jgi:archaellum component FlaC